MYRNNVIGIRLSGGGITFFDACYLARDIRRCENRRRVMVENQDENYSTAANTDNIATRDVVDDWHVSNMGNDIHDDRWRTDEQDCQFDVRCISDRFSIFEVRTCKCENYRIDVSYTWIGTWQKTIGEKRMSCVIITMGALAMIKDECEHIWEYKRSGDGMTRRCEICALKQIKKLEWRDFREIEEKEGNNGVH